MHCLLLWELDCCNTGAYVAWVVTWSIPCLPYMPPGVKAYACTWCVCMCQLHIPAQCLSMMVPDLSVPITRFHAIALRTISTALQRYLCAVFVCIAACCFCPKPWGQPLLVFCSAGCFGAGPIYHRNSTTTDDTQRATQATKRWHLWQAVSLQLSTWCLHTTPSKCPCFARVDWSSYSYPGGCLKLKQASTVLHALSWA